MKRTTSKLMIAAALLTAATAVASAETMNANIPFSFRFGKNTYPAGAYRVEIQDGRNVVRISNWEARQGSFLLPSSTETPSAEWRANGQAVAAFECGLGRCQLVRLWTGSERPAVNLPHPRMNRDEAATLRLIHLSRLNGD